MITQDELDNGERLSKEVDKPQHRGISWDGVYQCDSVDYFNFHSPDYMLRLYEHIREMAWKLKASYEDTITQVAKINVEYMKIESQLTSLQSKLDEAVEVIDMGIKTVLDPTLGATGHEGIPFMLRAREYLSRIEGEKK